MEEEIKKLGQPKKTKKWLISIFIIIIFIIILIISFLFNLSRGREINKKVAFKTLASSIVAAATYCCETPGAHFVVPPTNGGSICDTTDANVTWLDDTEIGNISITTNCQPDGSFKFHVEPGSRSINTENCKSADCTQEGCVFTGC